MSISFLIHTVHEHYFLVREFLKREISWKIIITNTEWDFLLNLQQYLLMDEENRVKGFIFILMASFTRKRKITLNLITQHYFYRPGLWKKSIMAVGIDMIQDSIHTHCNTVCIKASSKTTSFWNIKTKWGLIYFLIYS